MIIIIVTLHCEDSAVCSVSRRAFGSSVMIHSRHQNSPKKGERMNISYLCSYNERNPDVLHHLRLQMVRTAQQTSNKAAARTHQVDVKTVRLWRRRYEEDPQGRLVDRRPETTNHPQRLPPGIQLHLKNTVEKRIRIGQRVYVSQLRQHDRLLAPYSGKTLIKHLRRRGWSPEQISGRISHDLPGHSISHEAIYQDSVPKQRTLYISSYPAPQEAKTLCS